ncbi:MAG: transposase [Clostridia bacterium]|nr:transposase [Clostridia bacterium]
MPRKVREKSSTGIYHVMLRGINGQTIFKCNEDYEDLIQTLKEYKRKSGYEIYAYCLMSNHIHLLIKEIKEDLEIVFRRIGARYVYWYNWRYKRSGPLFQGRYKSEVVEDDQYFLTVMRYIHQNPIKAGIEKDIARYPWSSYNEYLGKKGICDTEFALSLFSHNEKRAISLFKEFNIQENDDECLEYKGPVRLNDEEATKMIIRIAGVQRPRQVQDFEKGKRNEVIKKLKDSGLSIRQIERLTGISFGIIRSI